MLQLVGLVHNPKKKWNFIIFGLIYEKITSFSGIHTDINNN